MGIGLEFSCDGGEGRERKIIRMEKIPSLANCSTLTTAKVRGNIYLFQKMLSGRTTNVNRGTAIARLKKKCGYWILIGNNLSWCRLHKVSTFDGESYGLSIFFRIQWQRLHFSLAFVKGQWNAIFLNVRWTVKLSRGASWPFARQYQFCTTRRTHCFCIPNMETTIPFGRAISVRQLPFTALSDNVFWNRCPLDVHSQCFYFLELDLMTNRKLRYSVFFFPKTPGSVSRD